MAPPPVVALAAVLPKKVLPLIVSVPPLLQMAPALEVVAVLPEKMLLVIVSVLPVVLLIAPHPLAKPFVMIRLFSVTMGLLLVMKGRTSPSPSLSLSPLRVILEAKEEPSIVRVRERVSVEAR